MTLGTAGPPTRPPWGPGNPLTAYCCAERAAAAIAAAETCSTLGNAAEHERLLQAAAQWRKLAAALATNPAMNRPRDPDRDDRRR